MGQIAAEALMVSNDQVTVMKAPQMLRLPESVMLPEEPLLAVMPFWMQRKRYMNV